MAPALTVLGVSIRYICEASATLGNQLHPSKPLPRPLLHDLDRYSSHVPLRRGGAASASKSSLFSAGPDPLGHLLETRWQEHVRLLSPPQKKTIFLICNCSSASFAEHMSRRPARCSPLRRCHPVTIALTGQRVWRHPSADGSMHSPAPPIISPQFGQEVTYCAGQHVK